MAEVINLRMARKARHRAEDLARAKEARAKSGRTKAEKARDRSENDRAARDHEGHKRD